MAASAPLKGKGRAASGALLPDEPEQRGTDKRENMLLLVSYLIV